MSDKKKIEFLRDIVGIDEKYLHSKKYRIESFVGNYDHILHVYESALGTSILQGFEVSNLSELVQNLKNHIGDKVLTISISSQNQTDDLIVILSDPSMREVIGVYTKRDLEIE